MQHSGKTLFSLQSQSSRSNTKRQRTTCTNCCATFGPGSATDGHVQPSLIKCTPQNETAGKKELQSKQPNHFIFFKHTHQEGVCGPQLGLSAGLFSGLPCQQCRAQAVHSSTPQLRSDLLIKWLKSKGHSRRRFFFLQNFRKER